MKKVDTQVKKMSEPLAWFSHAESHYLHDDESFCLGMDLRHRKNLKVSGQRVSAEFAYRFLLQPTSIQAKSTPR